jgi:hypothetical protein
MNWDLSDSNLGQTRGSCPFFSQLRFSEHFHCQHASTPSEDRNEKTLSDLHWSRLSRGLHCLRPPASLILMGLTFSDTRRSMFYSAKNAIDISPHRSRQLQESQPSPCKPHGFAFCGSSLTTANISLWLLLESLDSGCGLERSQLLSPALEGPDFSGNQFSPIILME